MFKLIITNYSRSHGIWSKWKHNIFAILKVEIWRTSRAASLVAAHDTLRRIEKKIVLFGKILYVLDQFIWIWIIPKFKESVAKRKIEYDLETPTFILLKATPARNIEEEKISILDSSNMTRAHWTNAEQQMKPFNVPRNPPPQRPVLVKPECSVNRSLLLRKLDANGSNRKSTKTHVIALRKALKHYRNNIVTKVVGQFDWFVISSIKETSFIRTRLYCTMRMTTSELLMRRKLIKWRLLCKKWTYRIRLSII